MGLHWGLYVLSCIMFDLRWIPLPIFWGSKKVHCGVLWRYSLYTLRVKGDTKARNSNSKIPQVSFNAARPSFTARICSLLVVSFTPIITSLTLAVGRILACYANGGATKNMTTEKDFGDLLGKIWSLFGALSQRIFIIFWDQLCWV